MRDDPTPVARAPVAASSDRSDRLRALTGSHAFVVITGVLWLACLVAPFYQDAYLRPFSTRLQSGPSLLFWFVALQTLQCGEMALLSAALRGAFGTASGRPMRAALVSCALLSTTGYHALVYWSWAYHGATGEFLSTRVLALAPFATGNPSVFWSQLSAADRSRLVRALLAAFGASGLAVAASWPRGRRWAVPGRLRFASGALALSVVIGLVSFLSLPTSGRSMALQLLRYGASPSMTLVWAPVIAPQPPLRLPGVDDSRFLPAENPPVGKAADDAPDLYVIVVEALRADVATAPEHADVTPFLHELATRPLSRTLGVSQATDTSESLAVMLSGNYALRSEARSMRVDERVGESVLERLQAAGYRTAFLGEEWAIDREMTRRGVDFRFNPEATPGAFAGDDDDPWRTGQYEYLAADRLKLRRLVAWAASERAPVAAFIYLQGSHYPYVDENTERRYRPDAIGDDPSFLGYDAADRTPMWNRYRNTLVEIDRLVRGFVDGIERERAQRPRVVVVTGDHGEAFGEHGEVTHARTIIPEVVRVPFLIDASAGWFPAGPRVPGHVDLFPTLITFAGLPRPPRQGDSLVARAPEPLVDRPVFVTSQLYVSEDAVVADGRMATLSYDTAAMRLFDLASGVQLDAHEPSVRLCACLLDFRALQFRYHRFARTDAYAPSHPTTCAEPPAALAECERLAGRRAPP